MKWGSLYYFKLIIFFLNRKICGIYTVNKKKNIYQIFKTISNIYIYLTLWVC